MHPYAVSGNEIEQAFDALAAQAGNETEEWFRIQRIRGEFLRELNKIVVGHDHALREEGTAHD